MGVAELSRLAVAGHRSLRNEIVEGLQELGVVELVDLREDPAAAEWEEFLHLDASGEAERALGRVNSCLRATAPYEEKKEGLLSRLTGPLPSKSRRELRELERSFDLEGLTRACEDHVQALQALDAREETVRVSRRALEPWRDLSLALDGPRETRTTAWLLGTIPQERVRGLQEELQEQVPEAAMAEVVDTTSEGASCVVVADKGRLAGVEGLLAEAGWAEARLPAGRGSVTEALAALDDEEREIALAREKLHESGAKLSGYRGSLLALADHYGNMSELERRIAGCAHSSHAFLVEGWVRKEDVGRVRQQLEEIDATVAVAAREPAAEESPPVVLQNSRFVTPYEMVTGMYSMPRRGELDPTPFLAPFFFIFFGLCLTDAGYGILLTAGSLVAMKKLRLDRAARRFLTFVLFCGIGTVISGVITGSWFGIDLATVPNWLGFLRKVRLFDPLAEPMTFFILAIALGYIQVWLGLVIRMVGDYRSGKRWNAVFAGGGWMLLMLSLPLMVAGLKSIAGVLAVAGCVSVGLLSGLADKSKAAGLARGIFLELISGAKDLLANVVSYSRLMALGLTTWGIGFAVNVFAGVARDMVPVVGIVVAILIIAGGHLFNLFINCLGAFVHTSRLQFVEFFPYFFQGGGRVFQPFCKRYKNIEVTG